MSDRIPEDVMIQYTSPDGGTVLDITTSVLYADAYFESQSAAVPGSFQITVKDPDQSLEFTSGGVIEMWIGGKKQFGGFVTVPIRDFFFPADDTSKPIRSRRWILTGIDFNLLLDKRVLRKTSGNTTAVPDETLVHSYDKFIIDKFGSYFDLGFSGGNTLGVYSRVRHVNDFSKKWVWPTLGSTMRQVLDALVIETTVNDDNDACVYWVDADAEINWLALHDTASPWGFSDIPDGVDFIGWRDGSVSSDGSSVINEVYVWGGSPIGSNGTVVVGHHSNAASISAHGLWQMAETHPGESLYKSQASVDARAKALVLGTTSGTSPVTGAQGLVNPDEQYSLTWFAHDVPRDGDGNRQHLVPGMVSTLLLWSFSQDGGVTPFSINVPLRQMRITFPTLPPDSPGEEKAYVQFEGTFGLLMSDPVWWWEFLRGMRPRVQQQPIITTNGSSDTFPYGSYFTGAPVETPDGTRTAFTLPCTYQPGTLAVMLNGLLQTSGWSESSPSTGGFTFTAPPVATDTIICTCRTG